MINQEALIDYTNKVRENEKHGIELIDRFVQYYMAEAGNIEWYSLLEDCCKEFKASVAEAAFFRAADSLRDEIQYSEDYEKGYVAGSISALFSFIDLARRQSLEQKGKYSKSNLFKIKDERLDGE